MPLADVGEFMKDVQVERLRVAGLEIPEARDDVAAVIVDVHVHVLGHDVDFAVPQDFLPQTVGENRTECRGTVESREHVKEPMATRPDLPVDADSFHRLPTIRPAK
jgi:hypothetical protein